MMKHVGIVFVGAGVFVVYTALVFSAGQTDANIDCSIARIEENLTSIEKNLDNIIKRIETLSNVDQPGGGK